MSGEARLQSVYPPFAAEFGKRGSLREAVGEHGRVHLDRWLPFLVLQRGEGAPESLARRVAVDSPAYLIWSPADDHAALSAIEHVASRLAEHSGHLLVITLDDQPAPPPDRHSPKPPLFAARIEADQAAAAVRTADALEKAMRGIQVDLRRCAVEREAVAALLPPGFDRLLDAIPGVTRLSLRLPQIHRRPDGGVYPAIAHDLAAASGDAILRAACAFLDDGKCAVPAHYRSLGRSAYLDAARKADRRIDRVARSFDFLLSISPIDTADALGRFLAAKCQEAPKFHYRPLTIDPDLAKRDLYAIDLSQLEDPLLENLLADKRREIDAQLVLLSTRNTADFRAASMLMYGTVDAPLLADARSILDSTDRDPPRGSMIGASEIADAAGDLVGRYRSIDPDFRPEIEIRDDVAGLLVSNGKLMIASDAMMPAHRLPALLAHEVSVHLLTHFNGAAQGLSIFRTGLARYEGVQEGLGVFAEWASGGLTRTRLRLIAGRVVAVEAMLRGGNFIEVWRLLHRDHGFSRSGAFGIAARVFRSGGLAKDAIYLQGFRAVIDLVASGASLAPFWLGKIAVGHVPVIEELLQRGLVRPPRLIPLFLDDEGARSRIASLRAKGTLNDMLAGA
ncbi:MAG: DUF1704 domain-containing protein [Sphingomonas sp.]|uniref:flavohemoglobin expression-modulating QEGLA motif protein n=1 Tax=Sphingomonas sp. TaxID=28214 RepID=UPI0017FEBA90|nr:tyrosine/phenylalanine carboxypeptidase domain-containing protein [Sphingomonas sp.]MBA3667488.1 DUF1704 domain-containing protein [Sphingomonas sp.]